MMQDIAEESNDVSVGMAFQSGLSSWNIRFLETAKRDSRFRQRSDAQPSFEGLHNHSWPTFVDADRIQEWARLSLALRNLMLRQGPELLPRDAQGIAAMFGCPVERADLIVRLFGDQQRREAFASKPDFLVSAAGLKCCELDFGDVGLWHLDTFNALFQNSPVIKEFVAQSSVRIRQRHPLRTAVDVLVKSVSRLGPGRDCNCAILVPDGTSKDAFEAGQLQIAYAGSQYQSALRSLGFDGELILERASCLRSRSGHGLIDGKRIHVVMTQTQTLTAEDQIWLETPLMDLVENRSIVAVNGPDCSALSNKIVLALVSEAADSSRLDDQTTALVHARLPWTRRVTASRVWYAGCEHWLPGLLVSRREEFVIKPGYGFSSDGVHIGRNTSSSDWEHTVARAVAQGNWVAQEAIGSVPLCFLDEAGNPAPHAVNIGVVSCGDRYAGIFLRLMPNVTPDQISTIGYSRGALTGGIIEVDG